MSAAEEKRERLRERLRAILAEVDPDAKVPPGPREDRMREARFDDLAVMEALVRMLKLRARAWVDPTADAEERTP